MQLTTEQELEIFIGADRVVRINLDGLCAMRTALGLGARVVVKNLHPTIRAALDQGAEPDKEPA